MKNRFSLYVSKHEYEVLEKLNAMDHGFNAYITELVKRDLQNTNSLSKISEKLDNIEKMIQFNPFLNLSNIQMPIIQEEIKDDTISLIDKEQIVEDGNF